MATAARLALPAPVVSRAKELLGPGLLRIADLTAALERQEQALGEERKAVGAAKAKAKAALAAAEEAREDAVEAFASARARAAAAYAVGEGARV